MSKIETEYNIKYNAGSLVKLVPDWHPLPSDDYSEISCYSFPLFNEKVNDGWYWLRSASYVGFIKYAVKHCTTVGVPYDSIGILMTNYMVSKVKVPQIYSKSDLTIFSDKRALVITPKGVIVCEQNSFMLLAET